MPNIVGLYANRLDMDKYDLYLLYFSYIITLEYEYELDIRHISDEYEYEYEHISDIKKNIICILLKIITYYF
jgi:hypothetical protein